MKVAIVNCGISNLGSIRRALADLGAEVIVAEEPTALFASNRIVLPGVGAFPAAMEKLHAGGWVDVIRHLCHDEGRPMLGICLGMQLLAQSSTEIRMTEGLGLVPGHVRRLDELGCTGRIPHIGWNSLQHRAGESLFAHVPQGTDFYFVHSFAFDGTEAESVCGHTDYGVDVVAAIRQGNVFGTQFHPEKSSRAGRQVLRNFLDHRPC
jgi:glutamine amidotransferase